MGVVIKNDAQASKLQDLFRGKLRTGQVERLCFRCHPALVSGVVEPGTYVLDEHAHALEYSQKSRNQMGWWTDVLQSPPCARHCQSHLDEARLSD